MLRYSVADYAYQRMWELSEVVRTEAKHDFIGSINVIIVIIILFIIISIVFWLGSLFYYCYPRNSKEAGEVVLTKEEQECRPLLSSSSSKTSESTRSARDSTKAQSASLLKQSLVKMCKQPRDAVNQHLLKVCCTAVFILVTILPAFLQY